MAPHLDIIGGMQRALVLSLVGSSVLAACGDDGNSGRLADAPPTSDAPAEPASRTVVLTVINRGAPQPGVRVYFLGAGDAVIASAETDASGNATADMPSGGSVTAIDPFPEPAGAAAVAIADNFNELRTFLGVKPGDHLYLTGVSGLVGITARAPEFRGALTYSLQTTCGAWSLRQGGSGNGSGSQDPGGPVTLTGCDGTADMMVLAFPPEKSGPSGALYRAGVSVNEGLAVDLTQDAYRAPVDVAFTYTNVPEGASSGVDVSYTLATSRGVLDPGVRALITSEAGGAAATVPVPMSADAGMRSVIVTDTVLKSRHQVVDWGPEMTSYELDLGTALLPDITSSSPAFDPATQRLTWTEAAATGPVPDLATASLSISRMNRSTQTQRTWRWEIAGPRATDGLKLPKLPIDLLDWAPSDNDLVFCNFLVSAKLPGGYDANRPRIFDMRPGAFWFAGAVAGESGRALTVEYAAEDVGPRFPRPPNGG